MKRLRMTELAEAEYREALAEYREIDPRVAERFAAETRRTLELMEEFPAIGGPAFGIGDAGVRQMPIHSFPYNIVVDNVPDPREVVAIAHKRRRPGYFARRLKTR